MPGGRGTRSDGGASVASRGGGAEPWLVLGVLLAGVGLLLFLLSRTDVREVWARLDGASGLGLALVVGAYLVGFAAETASWLQTLPVLRPGARSFCQLWKVLMVGNAVERVTPFGGLGGEPMKALLLNRYDGVPYAAATASLVITRMTDVMALILFLAGGLLLMWRRDVLPPAYRAAVLIGFGLFVLAGAIFFLVQNQRVFSRVRGWFGGRGPSGGASRFAALLDGLHDVEDRLVAFYSQEPRRLLLSVAFTVLQWSSEAVAIWLSVEALGTSIPILDAFAIQAFVLMVLSVLFFVPGDLGTQDAAIAYACGAITGSLPLGVAVAALRRARDLVWIVWGFGIGAAYAWRRPAA